MIIECPACATRYDIKATLPPEGRTVRCAKCGTVWRAMPHADTPEEAAADLPPRDDERELETGHPGSEHPASEAMPSENVADDGHAPDPSYSEANSETSAQHHVPEDATSEDTSASSEQEDAAAEPAEPQPEPDFEIPDPENIRWFESFRRRTETSIRREEDSQGGDAVSAGAIAETIPFPRQSHSEDRALLRAPGEELQTLEEARAAVRGVFSTLNEGRPFASAQAYPAGTIQDAAENPAEETLRLTEENGEAKAEFDADAWTSGSGTAEDHGWAAGKTDEVEEDQVQTGWEGAGEDAHEFGATNVADSTDFDADASSPGDSFAGTEATVDDGDGWDSLDKEPEAAAPEAEDSTWLHVISPSSDEGEAGGGDDPAAHLRESLQQDDAHQSFTPENDVIAAFAGGQLARELETQLRLNAPAEDGKRAGSSMRRLGRILLQRLML